MRVNSVDNNLQSFQGSFKLENLRKCGKETIRSTNIGFDKDLYRYVSERIINTYDSYIPEDALNGLGDVLRKIRITLPETYGSMIRFYKSEGPGQWVIKVPGRFKITHDFQSIG